VGRCNGPTSQYFKRQTPKEKGRPPLRKFALHVAPSYYIKEGKLVLEETRWAYLSYVLKERGMMREGMAKGVMEPMWPGSSPTDTPLGVSLWKLGTLPPPSLSRKKTT
jgi:hypothetical protein